MNNLNDLDKILLSRLIGEAKQQRKQNLSLDINDLVEAGYSIEQINASIQKISNLDARKLFEETKDIPDMTCH